MRKLKLDDAALTKLLDNLDAQDARHEARQRSRDRHYPYRNPGLRVECDLSEAETVTLVTPSRQLGSNGIHLLTGNLLHVGCPCRVCLVTVRNNWQTVSGEVERCRYLPGTKGVHEVFVRFHRRIDPASFAAAATCARILAADDSRVSLKLYERLLDSMNADLVCVSSGIEAMERALSGNFDLILMDVEMPEVDGLSAVRLLRSKGYVRTIVAVTALTDEVDRDRCLQAGCDDFLAKPLTRDTLADVVWRNQCEPLVSALLDDPAMTDLIDGFVESLAEITTRLESAFGSQNMEDLEREARTLKGEAAGIGFGSITDAAAVVENAARRQDDLGVVRAKLTELIRLCMSARPATSRANEIVEEPDTSLFGEPDPNIASD